MASTISGFRSLYVNGSDSLGTSILTTKLSINDTSITNSTVRLYIDGTNTYAYNVICSNDDTCFINCLSNTSCTNMILTCNGTCYLNCGDYGDANGNNCPSNISGVWYPLSSSPTIYPSTMPSEHPSVIPSLAPSQLPSKYPSKIPSTIPSHNPTIFFCKNKPHNFAV